MIRVGVLALQGGFAAHTASLDAVGAQAVEVRRPRQLDDLAGLVLPGGETTTLLNLMGDEPWFEALRDFHEQGRAIFATCAGTILLARAVSEPVQPSLGILDASVRRNAYGRQIDSFEADLDVTGLDDPLHAVFVRAPRFAELGRGVEALARFEEEPVLVRQGSILACTFHPELTPDTRLHRRFVEMAEKRCDLGEIRDSDLVA